MEKQPVQNLGDGKNHGEGDPDAAERFNKSEREFVNSRRGQDKIQEGPKVRADEEAESRGSER